MVRQNNAKIYTIFTDRGTYLGGGTNLLEAETFTTNEKLLNKLVTSCSDIEFIARDLTNSGVTFEKVYNELESSKRNHRWSTNH